MFYRRTPPIPGDQSVARLEAVEINGIKQYLLIRGENRHNPILLFLHGGPGDAQIGGARCLPVELEMEKEFVVVNWDQRGAGLSYTAQIPSESMTIDQFVDDARAVVEYLLRAFGQEKLFVVAHSWGTVVGTLLAARYPHLLYAYVGMGQVTDMAKNEAISYQYALDQARQLKHRRAIDDLERIGPPPYADPVTCLMIQRKWLRRFGGVVHSGNLNGLLLRTLLRSTEYTLPDFLRMIRGGLFSFKALAAQLVGVNLTAQVPVLHVPVYFILGRHDYTMVSALAADYLSQLKAPHKELIWFERSAHGLILEEPEAFGPVMHRILREQRYQKTSMAVQGVSASFTEIH